MLNEHCTVHTEEAKLLSTIQARLYICLVKVPVCGIKSKIILLISFNDDNGLATSQILQIKILIYVFADSQKKMAPCHVRNNIFNLLTIPAVINIFIFMRILARVMKTCVASGRCGVRVCIIWSNAVRVIVTPNTNPLHNP